MTLKLQNIVCGYKEGLHKPFDGHFEAPQLIALTGRNGSGKSTFLKTVSGWIRPKQGQVYWKEINIHGMPPKDRSHLINFISAREHLFFPMKVMEYLSLGRLPYMNMLGLLTKKDRMIIEHYIKQLQLTGLTDKYMFELSDGQYQKVKIARAMIQEVKLLLLDEPTNFLDPPAKKDLFEMLQYNVKQNKYLIFISTHEIHYMLRYCDKILFFNEGEIIPHSPDSIQQDERFVKDFL